MKFPVIAGLSISAVVLIYLLMPGTPAVRIEQQSEVTTAVSTQPNSSVTTDNNNATEQVQAPELAPEVKAAIKDVALAFEQSATYPPYSIPLTEHQPQLLTPNAGSKTQRSLEANGLPGELTVSLSAYRYRLDQLIEAEVSLIGNDELFTQVGRVQLSLRDQSNAIVKLVSANASLERERWSYTTSIEPDEEWPDELNLVAEVTLTNGESLRQSAPLRLFNPVAVIHSIGDARIEDNELVIPVNIRDAQPGFYKLGASLLLADKKPLAYLQGKAHLRGSSGTLELHAHGSLLSTLNTRQPLWLSSFQLRRIPEKPGPQVGYGDSEHTMIRIPDVNPDDFSSLPYQNAQVAQRLQFLQSLGQSDSDRSGS